MPEGPAYVIIGASLAGAKAAETLREDGFGGTIVLLGTEPERPYERPPLSKGYLLGKADKSSLYVHDEHWYAGHQVDLRPSVTAIGIDRGARRVDLDNGDAVSYDRLLLTTGSYPRVLQVPGGDLDGVHYLRTTADSEALATALVPIPGEETRVVIVGGGWIGLEVAAAAREKGGAVTVLEPEPTPLYRQIGPELGERFADLHRAHGVEFRLGDSARELRGHEGRVTAVLTAEGAELPADVVVVAIGAAPNVALAEAAGLEVAAPDQRRPRGRGAADQRPGHLRGRRRGQRGPPAAGPPGPGRALGQRAARRPGRGPLDARPAGVLRPGAVLLQRPVRPGHGDVRAARARALRRGGVPGRPGHAGVHRVLAVRRTRSWPA